MDACRAATDASASWLLFSAISQTSLWLERPDGGFLRVENMEDPMHTDQFKQGANRWQQATELEVSTFRLDMS